MTRERERSEALPGRTTAGGSGVVPADTTLPSPKSFRFRLLALVAATVSLSVLVTSLVLGYQLDRQVRTAFSHELATRLAIVRTTIMDVDSSVTDGVIRAASDNTLQITLDLAMTAQLARYVAVQRDVLKLTVLVAFDPLRRPIGESRSGSDATGPAWRLETTSSPLPGSCTADLSAARQIVACGRDVYLVAVAPIVKPLAGGSLGDATVSGETGERLGYLLGAVPLAGSAVIGPMQERGVDLPVLWVGDERVYPNAQVLEPPMPRANVPGPFDIQIDGAPFMGMAESTLVAGTKLTYGAIVPLQPLRAALLKSLIVIVAIGLAIVAISLAIVAVLARRLLVPVEQLKNGAREIESGRLGHRITVDSGDEFQSLAEQFNRMAEKLQDSYGSLERQVEQRTRQLEAANQAKSRFLAAASHDLRQPLHALNLFVGQLKAIPEGARSKAVVSQIAASVGAMNELFDDLLDIAKLDAGIVVPDPKPFDIDALFSRVETTFAAPAREKGLTLRLVRSRARVACDFVMLERIVFNLVSNAVKYTEAGSILVGCRREGQRVRIDVIDTGVGIAPEKQGSIFGEFVQLADESGRPYGPGLGLGLSIVERLATLMDCKVTMASRIGRGSRFSVCVDRASSEQQAATTSSQVELDLDPLRGRLIAIIDDDSTIRESTAALIRGWGSSAVIARHADEARRAFATAGRMPDLIISDHQLSEGITGLEFIAEVRSAAGWSVPSLLVTGDTSANVLRAAQAEAIPVLHKPVTALRLRATASKVLGDASPSRMRMVDATDDRSGTPLTVAAGSSPAHSP